ncbi:IclR family transcriptional regulator C-terminal domain-containing protein [Arthrobacter sp. NA-172]|uniref:IclR family transcriptional regulator domain-containing protein n=1 Tax=Arthrobacter sp. NA-172 TaxID=3367524 RepID=UPI0037545336
MPSHPETAPNSTRNDPDHVEALARGLSVLKAFSNQDRPLSVTDVAELVGITRTAARRFVLTLEYLGYLSFDASGYSLRPAVLELGDAYLLSHKLPTIAHPHLASLVQAVGETASLTVLHQGRVIYVDRVHADRVLTVNIIIGTSLPAYATATGRVLLSGLPDAQLNDYLESLVPESLTENTTMNIGEIRKRIAAAGEHGWSLADQELTEGLRSIAVPVRNAAGGILAAVNVSAHATRMSTEALRTTVLPQVERAAAGIADDIAAAG